MEIGDQQDWTRAPHEEPERPPPDPIARFDLFGWLEDAWALRSEDRTLADPRGIWHRVDGQEDYR